MDAGRATTGISSATSPWTVNLPASIASGDTLILKARSCAGATFTTPAGWSVLLANNSSDASDDNTAMYYRKADGTEGSTLSLTLSTTNRGAAIVWRITGAADPTITPPEITTSLYTTGNTNPVSITPTGGSKDYLWITTLANDGTGGASSGGQPSGYSNFIDQQDGGGGGAATKDRVQGASKTSTASSEDPGVWTNSAPNSGGISTTIAVYPAGPTAASLLPHHPASRHPLLRR